ncbi:hypothetical protein EBH_0048910 [Eimeria brunetti]|uniref:Uncharacterized protein n=1 Tax=Eimeria brunetti TaxID=51314 RepID=U6LL82_9EIME|nr:hypothetical protein EBH_0048910 [Eimeria brunetti]
MNSSSSTAEETKGSTLPGQATATAPGAPEEQLRNQQQQRQQARMQGLDDPVARALERWGASLANIASSSLTAGHTQREGALAGDKLDGCAAGEHPAAEGDGHRKCEPLRRMPVSSQVEAEFEAEGVSALVEKNPLSTALDAAVDRAAGALPLPDVSCAEALIRDLLPPPSCRSAQAHESAQPQPEPHAEALFERSGEGMRTGASSPSEPSPEALHSSSLPKVTSSRSRAEPDDPAWAATVYQEIRLEQPTAPGGSGAAAGSVWVQSWGSQGVGFKGHGNCDASHDTPFPSPKISPFLSQSSEQEEAQPQLSEEQSIRGAVPADTWEAPARPASKRRLELLRANDWRARRVGRAAVEIDMALPETQEAAGNVEALHLGPCDGNDESCAPGESPSVSRRGRILTTEVDGGSGPLPDLNAVLNAQKQQRQSNAHTHKDAVYRRIPSRAPLGGAVFLDEETLAADDLRSSATRVSGRIGSAPDPSNYTGAHELDMQRSFDQKWRHELLPVGGASPASKAAERQGTSGSAQRSKAGWSNPFRIPEGYIGTNEDRTKARTKRLALEIRLQRAQEAHRLTDGSQVSEEMNRSTADSLLFSAAQRRQERRLKELAKKGSKKHSRSKEMSWDVAYRKWARWARAHPTLARGVPRPSKAKLFADFRQKLEEKNRRRKELHQRNSVAQPALAAGRRPARQSIEEIRKEAQELAVQEARR